MLDQSGLSDRVAMMIVFKAARSLGYDPETLASNRSTIQRQRRKHREAEAAGIKEAFNPNTSQTVHWDGKLMSDLTGIKKVDRLPILVTTMGKTKLLNVPKIPAGTGQAMANAANATIRD